LQIGVAQTFVDMHVPAYDDKSIEHYKQDQNPF
jgi:hypothetical protein